MSVKKFEATLNADVELHGDITIEQHDGESDKSFELRGRRKLRQELVEKIERQGPSDTVVFHEKLLNVDIQKQEE